MIAWGRMVADGLAMNFRNTNETPLMRMFRIEYAKEYRTMKKLGYEFNDNTVKAFLRANR